MIDRYLLRRTFGPMAAVLGSTMLAFLLERLLRSVHLLSQTKDGFGYLAELFVNLAPHYLGLTLPVGFFIALFVVVNSLNASSEIDAMLASGISLSRIAAPFVALGVVLMVFSLLLYGFIQPYSRYAYRAVLHAAENAGWNGEVRPQGLLSPDRHFLLTADGVDATGQMLKGVFLRRIAPDGREDVLTASFAEILHDRDGRSVTLALHEGQQLSNSPRGAATLLTFSRLSVRLPLAPAARLLRSRGGGEESELTLFELARLAFAPNPPALPRERLLAELYSRLARAVCLPLMPLFAAPLGLTVKRTESTGAIAIAGLVLFSFQASLVFGQGLAKQGAVAAALAEGVPFGLFATICLLTFASSRKTPGENPVNWMAERVSDAIGRLSARPRPGPDPERPESGSPYGLQFRRSSTGAVVARAIAPARGRPRRL